MTKKENWMIALHAAEQSDRGRTADGRGVFRGFDYSGLHRVFLVGTL